MSDISPAILGLFIFSDPGHAGKDFPPRFLSAQTVNGVIGVGMTRVSGRQTRYYSDNEQGGKQQRSGVHRLAFHMRTHM